MIPPPGDDRDLDTLVLQAIRWHVPDRTYKTSHHLYPHTLATMACACKRPDLLTELLRAGATKDLSLALEQAVWWYSEECVEQLLRIGVVPTDTTLTMPLKDGRTALLIKLLQHGGNAQARFVGGASLLHLAVGHLNIEASVALIQYGLPIDARDILGRTPLQRACESWTKETAETSQELVFQLLERRASLNAQDDQGMTALMLAARVADEGFLEILCAAGANRALQSQEGLQAWEYAQRANKPTALAFLRRELTPTPPPA